MNWKQDNLITSEVAGELYSTAALIKLFRELKKEGYSGLSLGLIIDLIRQLERE